MKLIPLTQGYFAMVDDADYDAVSLYQWHVLKVANLRYAHNHYVGLLHRFLLEANSKQIIDHKDRNGLNNQRENIWICTYRDNMLNRNLYVHPYPKGVWRCDWVKSKNKYRATIWGDNSKLIHIGMYDCVEKAATAIREFKLSRTPNG